VDVAKLLQELCEGLRSLADQRHLFLCSTGPATFVVQADATKIRRIAQNLIMNAVKYTEQGGVTVTWGEAGAADSKRWLLQVCDTGPGLQAASAAPLASALESATQGAAGVESHAQTSSAPGQARRGRHPAPPQGGEGLGLSIVKRLCDMLDASIEIETSTGSSAGTDFRILIPLHYTS
jgi:signal transduction histidine kinase